MLYDVYINGEFLDTFDNLDDIKKWMRSMPDWARSVHADQGDVFEVIGWVWQMLADDTVKSENRVSYRFRIVKDVFEDCMFERC